MEFNRITTLLWSAMFAFCVAIVLKSRLLLGISFALGGLAFLLLFGGAIVIHYQHRKREKLNAERTESK